jgi:heme a synthase
MINIIAETCCERNFAPSFQNMNTILAKDQRRLKAWLWSGVLLVTFMVMVGGITRLTGSGLSIVKWKVITGTIPPLSDAAWDQAFREYQQTPQFQQINLKFTVKDFKGIYWWEFVHRLAGRVIGLVFLIPYIMIMCRKKWPVWLKKQLTIILLLGILQGIMGWVMVMSGLTELTYVSHYRLALHLSFALVLVGAILWTILEVNEKRSYKPRLSQRPYLFYCAGILLALQIVLGAFVAGLKAGFYYNTFPLMGDSFFPENTFVSMFNGVLLQFAHRWLAFAVAILIVTCWFRYRHHSRKVRDCLNLWFAAVVCQLLLGIFTLIYAVPIVLGVAHQVVAVALFGLAVYLLYYLAWPADDSSIAN